MKKIVAGGSRSRRRRAMAGGSRQSRKMLMMRQVGSAVSQHLGLPIKVTLPTMTASNVSLAVHG